MKFSHLMDGINGCNKHDSYQFFYNKSVIVKYVLQKIRITENNSADRQLK